MKLSFGYLKDVLAFIFASIILLLIFIFNIPIPDIIYKLLIILMFILDGIFSFFPKLHNLEINFK